MAAPAPAEKAVDLYNELILTSPADIDKLRRLVWKARLLYNKLPYNAAVMVAYVQGLAMVGDAAEAITVAERLWGYRHGLETFEQRLGFVNLLIFIGLYEKGLEYALPLYTADGRGAFVRAALITAAWELGDWQKFTLYAGEIDHWKPAIADLRAAGLHQHLASHQKIVRRLVTGRQVYIQPIITGDDGHAEISDYIYVAASYDERLFLEEKTHEELGRYYQSVGLSPTAYIPFLAPIILDVKAERMHTATRTVERVDGSTQ